MTERHKLPSTVNFKTRCQPCRIAVRADIENSVHSKENQPHLGAIRTSLSSDRHRIPSPGAVTLRFTDDWRLKTGNLQRSCNMLFPYPARRCTTTGLLEQMPRSLDRRASARMARTATRPLRSTLIVTPRSPFALAKSKPYVFAYSSMLMKRGNFFESIDWVSGQEHIFRNQVEPTNVVTRLFVPPIASSAMNVPAIVAKTNPLVAFDIWHVSERKRRSSCGVVSVSMIADQHRIILNLNIEIANVKLFEVVGTNATIRAIKLFPFRKGRQMQNPF